ncbi:MAG: dihydropteroate synthase [Blastochloris sp.]|nr:dihydropteroate synthase [Blastochloris sp.]
MLKLEYLHELVDKHGGDLAAVVASFELKGCVFDSKVRPYTMGVVNLSADSWYRESVCLSADTAIRRGKRLREEGADLIDVGAESTLPHAQRVDAGQQMSALVPVVKALSEEGILVSVETYQPKVTEACLRAGAAVLNLTGVAEAENLYRLVADHDAGVIICYVQGANVREVSAIKLGVDHTQTLLDYFSRQIELATKLGVKRIWIDPGMGFYYKNLQDSSERVHYQLTTFLNTFRLRKLGWPTCHALPHAFEYFEDEVRTAESFFAVAALLGKTDLLRTHEVAKVMGVIRSMQNN